MKTVPFTLVVPYCCVLGRYRPIRSASYHHCTLGPEDPMFGGYFPLNSFAYMMNAVQSWRILLAHAVSRAVRRAELRTGSRMPMSTAIMPITTNNSTSVNAECL